jgi:hypothetical protein
MSLEYALHSRDYLPDPIINTRRRFADADRKEGSMARATLVKTTAPGPYTADGVAITWTAAVVADKEEFLMEGNDLLLVRNEDASPHTFTITSAADRMGRLGHITAQSLAAGAWAVLGPFKKLDGWQQSTGVLYIEADDVNVEWAVIKLA